MSAFGEGLFGGYKTGHKNPSATRYVSGGKVGQQVIETVEDILTYPMMGIPERGITEETAKHFGIRVKLDGKTGLKHEAHYFPYLSLIHI